MRRPLTLLLGFGAALVCSQAVRVQRINPPVRGDLTAPPPIQEVLREACYDCHSNETRWPLYSALGPFSWLIQHDVVAGRRRLNFSDWTDYASDPDFFFSSRRRHTRSVSAFLLNRSSDLSSKIITSILSFISGRLAT